MMVSIVIPYFNASSTIEYCIEAIKKQMSPEDELIIVNDGSDENHLKKLEELNVCKTVNCLENSGAAVARNIGMAQAKHKNIIFVDADVRLHGGCLQEVKNVLSTGVDACFVIPSKDRLSNFFSDYKNLYMTNILSKDDKDLNYIYGSCCALVNDEKRYTWPIGLRLIEDNILGHELWKRGARIKKVAKKNFTHMKRYTAYSLIKNDFFVSYQFARFMVQEKRWKTLYTGSKFGHTGKDQKASIILAVLVLLTAFLNLWISFGLFLCWCGLSLRLFTYLNKERGPLFLLLSISWTYISHLVYFLGVLLGFMMEVVSAVNIIRNRIEQD